LKALSIAIGTENETSRRWKKH